MPAASGAPLVQSVGKKGGTKRNHLFKEVIVEDEAEDLRGSQLGGDFNVANTYNNINLNQN